MSWKGSQAAQRMHSMRTQNQRSSDARKAAITSALGLDMLSMRQKHSIEDGYGSCETDRLGNVNACHHRHANPEPKRYHSLLGGICCASIISKVISGIVDVDLSLYFTGHVLQCRSTTCTTPVQESYGNYMYNNFLHSRFIMLTYSDDGKWRK